MKIISCEEAETRDGTNRYYFIVESKLNEYDCSIEIENGGIISDKCTCTYGTFKESGTKRCQGYCRHINMCINYLKEIGIIKYGKFS